MSGTLKQNRRYHVSIASLRLRVRDLIARRTGLEQIERFQSTECGYFECKVANSRYRYPREVAFRLIRGR